MLDLADFSLQKEPEENLIIVFTRAWYYGSYTMAAEPIKSLELHYTMIQFLITTVRIQFDLGRLHESALKLLLLGIYIN